MQIGTATFQRSRLKMFTDVDDTDVGGYYPENSAVAFNSGDLKQSLGIEGK